MEEIEKPSEIEAVLQELVPAEHRSLVQEMADVALMRHQGMTPIQIQHFVLNPVEYPTEWLRLSQANMELQHRYFELKDLAFDCAKAQLKAQLKEEEAEGELHPIKRKLLLVERDRNLLKAEGIRARAQAILREACVFHAVRGQHKHLEALPPEEKQRLEMEGWQEKARNMPLVFEERYGEEFMRNALGTEGYEAFQRLRRKVFGVLPREVAQEAQKALAGNANPALNRGGKP